MPFRQPETLRVFIHHEHIAVAIRATELTDSFTLSPKRSVTARSVRGSDVREVGAANRRLTAWK